MFPRWFKQQGPFSLSQATVPLPSQFRVSLLVSGRLLLLLDYRNLRSLLTDTHLQPQHSEVRDKMHVSLKPTKLYKENLSPKRKLVAKSGIFTSVIPAFERLKQENCLDRLMTLSIKTKDEDTHLSDTVCHTFST